MKIIETVKSFRIKAQGSILRKVFGVKKVLKQAFIEG